MSFGFGVGDFLAALELANKVWQKWKDAPDEYNTMKDETKNVNVLLGNVQKLGQQGTLSDEHIAQIKDSSANCLKVLKRCESLADKFPTTTARHSTLKSKWKRLQLDPTDVRAVRDQLTSCVSSLSALLTAIQSFQVNKISRGIDDIHDREARILLDTIADWYSSDGFAKHQDYYLSLRLPGTDLWALTDPIYKQWENGDTNTLLCPGMPGSGKSILHATLVHDLRSRYEHDAGFVVIYFYCSFQRQAEQTVRNILAVLVRQMLQEQRQLYPEVKDLYDKHCNRRTNPTADELEDLLQSLVQRYRRVYILMDAMDECVGDGGVNNCVDVLDRIFRLQRSTTNVKLLATTRWVPRIIEHFQDCPQLEIRAHREDIEQYLDHNIPRLPVKPHVKIRVDDAVVTIQDAVKSRIIDAADGMFLLARLQFDSLTDKTNPRKLQQALLQLDRGSEALEFEYDKALLRVDQQREGFREIAYKVLTWIVYAQRELSIDELQEAVAVYDEMDDLDHDIDLEEEQQLASVCAGLVRIDREAGVVRLVHYTTQKYLENALPQRSEGEISIARDCLTYLSMDVFKNALPQGQIDALKVLRKYKLFWYATDNWGKHIRPEFELEQDLIFHIDGLLLSPELFKTATRFMFEDRTAPNTKVGAFSYAESRHNFSPAHVCAYFDMSLTISRIIDRGGDLNNKDTTGKTPLFWAAQHGCKGVAKILLGRSDILADSRDDRDFTPLHAAVVKGHLKIIELLVRRADVNINSITKHGYTPLHLAVYRGHTHVVRFLLQQKGIRAGSRRTGDTILREAVKHGNTDIVKLLIERPELSVDTSLSGSGEQGTGTLDKFELLTRAIERQNFEILKVLMQHTFIQDDPLAFDEADLLHCAVVYGTEEILEHLLSLNNANPNVKDSHGLTLLSKAASHGRVEIVKALLKRPIVDPEPSGQDGRTPLSYAAELNKVEIAQELLRLPAINSDSSDSKGRTPLSYAAQRGSLGVVRALLQRSSEVDPDSSDHDGRTPLSHAAASKNEEIVQCLLAQHAVKPNSRDHRGRTPLSHGVETGTESVVKILLGSPGVDCSTTDDSGLSPSLWAVERGRSSIVGLFLRQWIDCCDSAEAYSTLVQKEINNICGVWEEIHSKPERCWILDLLGRCLLYLGYTDTALLAFRHQVTFEGNALLGMHGKVSCDGCGMLPIRDKRFVCKTCIDLDLCTACMREYANKKLPGGCVNHGFLEVPGQKNSSKTLENSTSLEKGFRDLGLRSLDQAQSVSNTRSTAPTEWRQGIEQRYRHWGFVEDRDLFRSDQFPHG